MSLPDLYKEKPEQMNVLLTWVHDGSTEIASLRQQLEYQSTQIFQLQEQQVGTILFTVVVSLMFLLFS